MPEATAKRKQRRNPAKLYALFQYLNGITMITSISQATAKGVSSTTANTIRAATLFSKASRQAPYSFCNRMVGILSRKVKIRHRPLSFQALDRQPSRVTNWIRTLPAQARLQAWAIPRSTLASRLYSYRARSQSHTGSSRRPSTLLWTTSTGNHSFPSSWYH